MKKLIWAVIFDMDGVIIDSLSAHQEAIRRLCHHYDRYFSEKIFLNQIYGRPNREWIPRVFKENLDPARINQLADEKESIFRDILKTQIQPINGLPDLLNELHKNRIPIIIASSAPVENIRFIVKHTGLEHFFPKILDESSVKFGKPDPQIFIRAAAELHKDPAACIVFEDSLVGIASAQSAGCKVVGVATTLSYDELAHADLVIKDFTEVDINKLSSLVDSL